MAVVIQCVSLVIRIDAIQARYPGGWPAFLQVHQKYLGGAAWHDAELFCISVMDGQTMRMLVRDYEAQGMVLFNRPAGAAGKWHDGCVFDGTRLTAPCDWVEKVARAAVCVKGSDPGPIVSRKDFAADQAPD
jgi:hypothetical protein